MKKTIILIILFAVPLFCFLILKNINAEESSVSCPGFCNTSPSCPSGTISQGGRGCGSSESCHRCGFFWLKKCCNPVPQFCCAPVPSPIFIPTSTPTPKPTPIPIFKPTPTETVVPSGVAAQFDELERKYENKKWRGALKGEMAITMPGMSCTQTYTARIDKMWINFNAPETGSYIGMGSGRRMSIDGDAMLESAHISCTCAEINVEISSFPFKLDGVIDFPEGTINFNAEDPEADKGFKALYTYTCDPELGSFYGDDEVLFSIFDPHMAAFKFEGDKIILSAEFSNLNGGELFPGDTSGILKNTNTKENLSGTLSPF